MGVCVCVCLCVHECVCGCVCGCVGLFVCDNSVSIFCEGVSVSLDGC